MARNGSGVYSLPEAAFVYNTVIDQAAVNSDFSDIASALTASIAADGQTTITASLPLNSNKLTGLAVGSAATDSASLGQVQAEAFIWCGTMTGSADAGVLTPSPAITAYAAGQRFVWMASSNVNTGAMTVAISGLSTIAVQNDGSALAAGDHAANKMYMGVLNTTSIMQIMRVSVGGLADDSVTTAKIAASAVTTAKIAASAVTTAKIADDAVTLAKMASGTDGVIITYDASGNPVHVGPGSDGEVLTSTGAGSPPAFEAAAGGGAYTSITNTAVTATTNIDFTGFAPSTYDNYEVWISNVQSVADYGTLWIQTSTDGGSSYDTGSTDYAFTNGRLKASYSGNLDSSEDAIVLTIFGASNASNENFSFKVQIYLPAEAEYTAFSFTGWGTESDSSAFAIVGGGFRKSAADVNAIRISWKETTWQARGKIQFLGIAN
jgi:hypothetical protein